MSIYLYYFNPGHENALHNSSPYYTSPANVVKMQSDLAYLPAWYASGNDFVLVNKILPDDFRSTLENLNTIAKEVTISDLIFYSPPINEVHLWGISPQSIYKFEQLNKNLSIDLKSPKWKNDLIRLSSRETAKDCLTYLVQHLSQIHENIIPAFFYHLEDIEQYVMSLNYQLIAKAPYSSSGRGLLWLPIGQLNRTEKQILHGILKKQFCVSIEKVLNKIVDFAMEFEITASGKCSFTAYSLFYTNEKGNYSHNFIGSQQYILNLLSQYIKLDDLYKISNLLIEYIENHFSNIYSGCIGVDMMIYKEYNSYHIHPCLEINVRDNMGLVAHSISKKHISSDSQGFFYIDYTNIPGEQMTKNEQMQNDYPLVIVDKKIRAGYLSLCPVTRDTYYRAYILINSTQ